MRPAGLRPLAPEASFVSVPEGRKRHWNAGLRHVVGWRASRWMPPICRRFGAIVAGLPLRGRSRGSPDSLGEAVFDCYDSDGPRYRLPSRRADCAQVDRPRGR